MNELRLTHYPGRYADVKTEVNGTELQQVREISLECKVGEMPTLRVEQNVYPTLDVTLNGIVIPTVVLLTDEFELHVEHLSPTQTHYWATRRPSVTKGTH